MPSAHAKLSPSAASRWLQCPGSIRLSVGIPRTSSRDADRGTAGHKLFELCMKKSCRAADFIGKKLEGVKVDEELAGWVQEGLDWVHQYLAANPGSYAANEMEIDIGPCFGLPVTEDGKTDFWGTSDLAIISPRRLVILDLKLGYGEVQPEDNEQLMSYGLGFERMHAELEFDTILLVILQPRNGGPKTHIMTVEDLHTWRDEVKSRVVSAYSDPEAPLCPSEDACRWCPAAAVCPKLKEHALLAARDDFFTADVMDLHPERLTVEELSEILSKGKVIKAALAAYAAHAQKLCELGTPVPGWKRVLGKKHRQWKDEAGARATLRKLGYEEDDFAPREILTPAKAEKLVGKATAKALATFIFTPEGEPTLVPDDDPRPALPPDFTSNDGKVLP